MTKSRKRALIAAAAVAGLLAAGGAGYAGSALAGRAAPAAVTAPASTRPATPAKPHPARAAPAKVTRPAAPAKAAPAPARPAAPSYAQDILNAGITAPVPWINTAGAQLAADWRAGYTAAWTDANVLLPAGVWPSHLAPFDQITARHFGVTPPAQGIEPAPAAPAAPAPAPSPSTSAPPVSGDPVAGTGTGPACTTVAGYFPGGLPGHEDERPGDQGFCIPDHLG